MSVNYPELCGRFRAIACVAVMQLEDGVQDPEMTGRLRTELDAALAEGATAE